VSFFEGVEEVGVDIHTHKNSLWWSQAEIQQMVVSGKRDYLKALEAARHTPPKT
jgi:hypothetical protein